MYKKLLNMFENMQKPRQKRLKYTRKRAIQNTITCKFRKNCQKYAKKNRKILEKISEYNIDKFFLLTKSSKKSANTNSKLFKNYTISIDAC